MKRGFYLLLKLTAFTSLVILKSREIDFEQSIIEWANAAEKLLTPLRNLVNYSMLLLGLNLLMLLLKYLYRQRRKLSVQQTDNVLAGFDNIYIIISSGALVVLIMGFLGIDPKSLLTGLSIVAAAIAIITKEYIANIIGGIAISFSDEISIGDYIKMEQHKGRVTDITISRIALLTMDDEVIYIPHSKIFNSEVINYTKSGIRRVSISFEINISILNTVEEFEKDLVENITEYHGHIESDSFWLKIDEIRKDNVLMKFQFILKSIQRELEREIRKKTVRSIVNYIGRHQA